MHDNVTIPRWVVEWLLDIAKEHRAQNEWRRGSTDRNSSEMARIDDNIRGVEQYLADSG